MQQWNNLVAKRGMKNLSLIKDNKTAYYIPLAVSQQNAWGR